MSEIKHIEVTATVEELLIPINIKSKFKSMQDWLTNICQGKIPKKKISEYVIRLVSSQVSNEHIVCLYGVSTRFDAIGQPYTSIDFKPSSVFFKFPKIKYNSFSYKQMQEELTNQLKDFISTQEFHNSFLSNENIRMSFSDKPIWLKK